MKKITFLISVLAGIAFSGFGAHAATLVCASKKDAHIYFTDGQVRLAALFQNESQLRNVNMTFSELLGSGDAVSKGVLSKNRKWVRYVLSGDALCSYRLMLPIGYSKAQRFGGMLDSFCEENSNYSVPLACAIRP